jgi:hypothetical protein
MTPAANRTFISARQLATAADTHPAKRTLLGEITRIARAPTDLKPWPAGGSERRYDFSGGARFTIATPDKHDWSEATVHFNWGSRAARSFLSAQPAIAETSESSAEDDDETKAAIAYAKLTPAQKAIVVKNVPHVQALNDIEPLTMTRSQHAPVHVTRLVTVTGTPEAAIPARFQQRAAAVKAATKNP